MYVIQCIAYSPAITPSRKYRDLYIILNYQNYAQLRIYVLNY